MNTRDFDYFQALAQLHSYTAVAKEFQVSQPSISYAVKRLEEQFHCQLIEHDPSHRTFHLTPQGEILLRHIKQVLPELQAAQSEIIRSMTPYTTIGFPPIIIDYLVRTDTHFIQNIESLASIHPIQDGSLELLDMVKKGHIDASLIGSLEPISDERLAIKNLFNRDLYYIVNKKHPLASRKELTFSDILDQDFLLLDEHFVHLKAFHKLNEKYHHYGQPFFQTEDVNLLKQLIRKNVGISLLADIFLTEGDQDLVAIPMAAEDQLTFFVSFITLKETQLDPTVLTLFQGLVKNDNL